MTILQNCKLTYFGIPGRGEATRLALSIGNVKFVDDRVDFKNWKDTKATTPWGSLPILTLEDNTVIAQQRAILRLVGKETGLYPTSDHCKAAKIDEFMDATEDIGSTTMKAGLGMTDKAAKEAERAKYCAQGGPTYELLKKIDTQIGVNPDSDFAVGDSLTIADLFIHCQCNSLTSGLYDGVPSTTLEPFHHIMALRKAVRSHPGVMKWYKELEDANVTVPPSYGLL